VLGHAALAPLRQRNPLARLIIEEPRPSGHHRVPSSHRADDFVQISVAKLQGRRVANRSLCWMAIMRRKESDKQTNGSKGKNERERPLVGQRASIQLIAREFKSQRVDIERERQLGGDDRSSSAQARPAEKIAEGDRSRAEQGYVGNAFMGQGGEGWPGWVEKEQVWGAAHELRGMHSAGAQHRHGRRKAADCDIVEQHRGPDVDELVGKGGRGGGRDELCGLQMANGILLQFCLRFGIVQQFGTSRATTENPSRAKARELPPTQANASHTVKC
jgi:hypothetical protein